MTAPTLLRLSGIALVLALPLSIPGYVIHPRTHELADVLGSSTSLSHGIVALGWALVLLGLPGLYTSHAARTGLLGLAGFVLMMLFAAYHVFLLLYEAGPVAIIASEPGADQLFAPDGAIRQGMLRQWAMPITLLATIVYGAALLRSRLYSPWAGWLVIAFLPLFFALQALLTLQSPATQDAMLDLGYANFGLGAAYIALNGGLAIAGYQLWRAQASPIEESGRPPSS